MLKKATTKGKGKTNIPVSVDSVIFKSIVGNKTDNDGNLHISLEDNYEIVCHDVIGDNAKYSNNIRSIHSDMKLSDKKGWILKNMIIDDDSGNITIYIAPTNLVDLENGTVFYKFKMVGEPLRRVDS